LLMTSNSPSAVANRHHQAEGAVVQGRQQPSGERFGLRLIERDCASFVDINLHLPGYWATYAAQRSR
jgi:hypothetical protein